MPVESAGGQHRDLNEALNYITSANASAATNSHFGGKSVLVVGDLFQLPAVEKFRFRDQIYFSTLWPAFRFVESCARHGVKLACRCCR